jgi:hypothetical protein
MAENHAPTTAPPKQGQGVAGGKEGGGFGPPYKAGSKYPKGDPAKGKDPEKDIPMFIKGPQIAMRDRRAYLVDQAVKNEAANDEVNAKQVENNQRIAEIMFDALDPDKLRDETTEAALEELDRHTPEYAAAARAERQKILRLQPLYRRGHTPEDNFIAGTPPAPEAASSRKADKDK